MKLPRVHRVTRGDKVHRYHRRTRAPLPDLPEDDPAFIEAWLAEEQRNPRPTVHRAKPGTVAELVQQFRQSIEFLNLSNDYRRVVSAHLEAITEIGGEYRAKTLRTEHIQRNLRPLTPHQSAARLKAWRVMCRWGLENGYLAVDPARDARRKALPRTAGHEPWSMDQVDAFRARWPMNSRERLAFELLFYTGARISDAVRIGPQHIDRDGWLNFTQAKTGGDVSIPVRRPLSENLTALEADRHTFLAAIAHCTYALFLVTTRGKGWAKESFGNWFGKLSPDGRSAHGLRKTRAIILSEIEATTHQIAAWTGHESLTEVQRYTRRADRRRVLSRNETGSKPVNATRTESN